MAIHHGWCGSCSCHDRVRETTARERRGGLGRLLAGSAGRERRDGAGKRGGAVERRRGRHRVLLKPDLLRLGSYGNNQNNQLQIIQEIFELKREGYRDGKKRNETR